jgi:hypothetical protein
VQWGWYIGLAKNAKGLGNAQHFGHLKMKPDEVKKPLASIGQDELGLLQSMAEDDTFSQPPAVETMQSTKRNSSAFHII